MECYYCDKIKNNNLGNVICENVSAVATANGIFREGHSTVIVKAHKESVSQIEEQEYHDTFELITKVSKALEQKYDAEKTYLLAIGDAVEHVHFHLIPKHKDKVSMGEYCYEKLFEAEGLGNLSAEEKAKLTHELQALLEA